MIWIGTALHNAADGMIVGIKPGWKTALPLFIHEISHTLCNVSLYMILGMTLGQAVILRIGSCIFVFVGALAAKCATSARDAFHTPGHAFVLGVFVYMMLVDVLPILLNENQGHGHCSEAKAECCPIEPNKHDITRLDSVLSETRTIDIEKPKCKKSQYRRSSNICRKLMLFVIFIISFGIVAVSILAMSAHGAACCEHKHKTDINKGCRDIPHQRNIISFGNDPDGIQPCTGIGEKDTAEMEEVD